MVLHGERAVVSTLAGGVTGTSFAFADASGTFAAFFNPKGVAVDASGNVFVADEGNRRIRKVTASGGTRIGPVTLRARAVRTLRLQRWHHRVGHLMLPLFAFHLCCLSRVSFLIRLVCCFSVYLMPIFKRCWILSATVLLTYFAFLLVMLLLMGLEGDGDGGV